MTRSKEQPQTPNLGVILSVDEESSLVTNGLNVKRLGFRCNIERPLQHGTGIDKASTSGPGFARVLCMLSGVALVEEVPPLCDSFSGTLR